ncbi:hypothetical protein PF003_g22940 [Phytophthora fragariae]|nr:hypothetical protein PF003_g22940 [Phytophthora fragariae]
MHERPELFHARFDTTKRPTLDHRDTDPLQDTSWALHVKSHSGG